MDIIFVSLYYLIRIIIIFIFVSAILSWFPGASQSRVGSLLNMLTEPVVSPVRRVMMRFEFMRSLPVDFSPMVAVLILLALQSVLQAIASALYA